MCATAAVAQMATYIYFSLSSGVSLSLLSASCTAHREQQCTRELQASCVQSSTAILPAIENLTAILPAIENLS